MGEVVLPLAEGFPAADRAAWLALVDAGTTTHFDEYDRLDGICANREPRNEAELDATCVNVACQNLKAATL